MLDYCEINPADYLWPSPSGEYHVVADRWSLTRTEYLMYALDSMLCNEEPDRWRDEPSVLWAYLASTHGYISGHEAAFSVWNTIHKFISEPDLHPSYFHSRLTLMQAVNRFEEHRMWESLLRYDRFRVEGDNPPTQLNMNWSRYSTDTIFNLDSWCDNCEEYYSGDVCGNMEFCSRCDEYFHDIDYHYDYDHGGDRHNEDYGDPNDDQGWTADLTGVPMVAPEGRRRFGIEIEFNGGIRQNIVHAMLHNGMACIDRGYTHDVVRYWKMVDDSTVTGGELVSPIMLGDDQSIEEVLEAIRIIKDHGGVTGSNCGMHVHVDCTDMNNTQLRTLANNLQRCQNALQAYVADSRFNGESEWSHAFRDAQWRLIHEWMRNVDLANRSRTRDNREMGSPVSRYSGFNFNSLLTYGSIEIRLLGHTLNTIKVKAWIRVLQSLFVASMRGRTIRNGVGFIDWLKQYGDLDDWSADTYNSVVESRNRPAEWLVASTVAA